MPPAAELKANLLDAAERSAAAAKEEAVARIRHAHAQAAKTALEAAGLVEGATAASEVDAALARLGQELADAGLMQAYGQAESVEAFMREVLSSVIELRGRVVVAETIGEGYRSLYEFLERLERDFESAGTETASRTAARIRGGLDGATERITAARREVDVG